MTTLYIYDNDSREVIAEITGSDNAACERIAGARYGDTDAFGWTYSPAFGATDGLVATADCEREVE